MALVKGKNVLFEVYSTSQDDYIPVVCCTGVTLDIKPEIINTTTVSSGRWFNRKVRRIDWSVQLSGIIKFSTDALGGRDPMAFAEIDNIIAGYAIRITFTDADGDDAVFTGNVLSEDITLTGEEGDFAGFDLPFVGNGLYTLTKTYGRSLLTEDGVDLILENGELFLLEV